MAPGNLPAEYREACCVHVPINSYNYFQLHDSFAVPPSSKPAPKDDSIPLAKLQPWIDMMCDLLLESYLSPDAIVRLIWMYVPKQHQHAIKPLGIAATLRTFHPFPRLPKNIRVAIWRIAATRPPRVPFWQNDYDEGGPPLNSPAKGLMAALACKEAWLVIKYRGCSFDMQSIDNDASSERVRRPIWVAARDLVFAPFGVNANPTDPEPQFHAPDLLRARKQVALDYDHFVQSVSGGYPEAYRFLGGMKKLDTVICVTAAPEVCLRTNDDNEDTTSLGLTKQQLQTTKLLQKLVLLEDREEVRALDMLWRGVSSPAWRWLSRANHDLLCPNVDAHAPQFVSRCYECEMRHWERTCLPRLRRAWVRMLYGEGPGQGADMLCEDGAEIYPNGLAAEPRPDHPWVKEALARMPRFKPAVLLMFKKRRPRYDEKGRRTNSVSRKGY